MKRSSAAVILLVFATGCVSRSELDRANQEILVLRAQVSQLQRDLADATARLSAAETAAARKPPLPVRLSFRRAVTDPSFVAVFETVLKTNLPVLVTWKSKALGTSRQFPLSLPALGGTELGYLQGAAIQPGDEIIMSNTNYEPITQTFRPQ
jgi:outer membrane murein-binding lipoprotein Lpp